jgi:hypothetical protein
MAHNKCRTAAKVFVILLFVAALIVAGKAASIMMPYRVLETEYFRCNRVWFGALAVAAGCLVLWITLASTEAQKTTGWFAVFALIIFFLFGGPNGPHSIIRMKNICISQLREIDGAKEQWAELNSKRAGDEVYLAAVVELLKSKKVSECPKGGAYWIGKVGEIRDVRLRNIIWSVERSRVILVEIRPALWQSSDMIALRVTLNEKLLCVAGADDLAVLNAIVGAVGNLGAKTRRDRNGRPDLYLSVGGLTNRVEGPDEHVRWAKQRRLRKGDKIQVEVLETDKVDSPKDVSRAQSPEERERFRFEHAKKEYLALRSKFEAK